MMNTTVKHYEVATREQAIDLTIAHLTDPQGHGYKPEGAFTAAAGSPECGNKVFFHVLVENDIIADIGFEEDGCETLMVVGSIVAKAMKGAHIFDAALVSVAQINANLGGLHPTKLRAAELVVDAAHVALGRAAYMNASVTADPTRSLVAMSGGVDSSVVALLARKAGGHAVGVTLELWRDAENDEESSCCSVTAVRAARSQAHNLDIPHFTLDLRAEFAAGVVEPYLQAHRDGQTPNPCVNCNGDVRLDAMIDLADRLGADHLATGHYARISSDEHGNLLQAAVDPKKDQTYMLSRLSAHRIGKLRFPLGAQTKDVTRAIAAEYNLVSAHKRDSQDLCFISGTTTAKFLARHGALQSRPGDIVDTEGNVLGQHEGTHLFTIGQRKGLGIAWNDTPWFVIRIKAKDRQVVVGKKADLLKTEIPLRGVRLLRDSDVITHVRLRYHAQEIPCVVEKVAAGSHSKMTVRLLDATSDYAPGQSAQFLSGDLVVGQGTIGAM